MATGSHHGPDAADLCTPPVTLREYCLAMAHMVILLMFASAGQPAWATAVAHAILLYCTANGPSSDTQVTNNDMLLCK